MQDELKKLTEIARIDSGIEYDSVEKVLKCIEGISKVDVSDFNIETSKNIVRSDEGSSYDNLDAIIKQLPKVEKGYLNVKDIL